MKYNIISVEGEYASGTAEIGQMISTRTGIPCYDEEVLRLAAMRGHTSIRDIDRLEETTKNDLLRSVYLRVKSHTLTANPQKILSSENEIIQRLVPKGPCIIVGRGVHSSESTIVPFSVFIYSDREHRADRVAKLFGIRQHEINAMLISKDKRLASQYRAFTGMQWNDRAGYHMMLDSGKLGMDCCAQAIIAALEKE